MQSQPDQGAIIVNLMSGQADKNSPADKMYASDLMMNGWTSADGTPGRLKLVFQEDITNTGTQQSIMDAITDISPNWIPDAGPVELRADSTDPKVQKHFNILAGTDNVIVSTRMFTDYSTELGKKSLISIKIWHDIDEEEDDESAFGILLQYG